VKNEFIMFLCRSLESFLKKGKFLILDIFYLYKYTQKAPTFNAGALCLRERKLI